MKLISALMGPSLAFSGKLFDIFIRELNTASIEYPLGAIQYMEYKYLTGRLENPLKSNADIRSLYFMFFCTFLKKS